MNWPHKHLDYDVFMKWAREAFETAARVHSDVFPFKTPFETDFHFVGEDHVFTDRVNKAMPLFIPRVQKEGIRIPGGEIAVISYVRKSKAYQEEAEPTGGVWTFDRVVEIPESHPLIASLKNDVSEGSKPALADVRQWFAIGRFQATPDVRPPVVLFVFGLIGFRDGRMGGVCPITSQIERLFGVNDANLKEVEHQIAYECCETLRQVAAIVYLDSEEKGRR